MNHNHLIKPYTQEEFVQTALSIFRFQAKNTLVYKDFLAHIQCNPEQVKTLEQIPFLPISFFKTHPVIHQSAQVQFKFLSSGTTNANRSKHLIVSPQLYEMSFLRGFEVFFGSIQDYTLLALLPSYLEQQHSSLVYMVNHLIQATEHKDSGFYLHNYKELIEKLDYLEQAGRKTLLIGVTYALLDVLDLKQFQLKHTLVMETGGMKGRRQEMIKTELHHILKSGFGVDTIYSEYGMTELLSQAYSMGATYFKPSPWMKILIREVEDPFTFLPHEQSGGINVIDLANVYSCSFIETQDLGKTHADGTFEVLGRFDHSDIRGCNLMMG
jgi:phenylacetate-coenzyme A ligase PaaK-like adenylate-forming protein